MVTAVYQQVAQHVSDMFTPLPEERSPTAPRKDGYDYVTNYLDAWGAWDLWRVVSNALEYIVKLPNLSESGKELTTRISGVSNIAGLSLSVPAFLIEANAFRKHIFKFAQAQDLPYSDGLRHQKILQSGKDTFVSGMSLTWVGTQAALFAHEVKMIDLGKSVPLVNFIADGASIITDGAELVSEVHKINAYQAAQARTNNPQESTQLEENLWLSWMVIIKDVSSLAVSIIGVVGFAIGVATASLPIVVPIILGMSTIWLAAKLTSGLYDQVLADRRAV